MASREDGGDGGNVFPGRPRRGYMQQKYCFLSLIGKIISPITPQASILLLIQSVGAGVMQKSYRPHFAPKSSISSENSEC